MRGLSLNGFDITPLNNSDATRGTWSDSPRRRLSHDFPSAVENGLDDGDRHPTRKDSQRSSTRANDEFIGLEEMFPRRSINSSSKKDDVNSDNNMSESKVSRLGYLDQNVVLQRKGTYFNDTEGYGSNIATTITDEENVLSDIEWWNKRRDDVLQYLRKSNEIKDMPLNAMVPFSVLQRSPEILDINSEDEGNMGVNSLPTDRK